MSGRRRRWEFLSGVTPRNRVMTDFIEEYRRRVRKRLSRSESEPFVQLAEVLCFPSFHAETLLQVTERLEGTTFRLFTFSSSLWYSDEGKEPTRYQESIPVPQDLAELFWASIENLNPASIQHANAIGLDGMSVNAAYRHGKTETDFEAWSPAPESAPGRYICLIYDLAWKVVNKQLSIERLEQLHGYLQLGLSARVIDGEVKCLRLFGSLSSNDEEALRTMFSSFGQDEPLLIDMTNFDGTGTLLYTVFIEFASHRQNVAWAASKSARTHIDSMGLTAPKVFETTDDAVEWLREHKRR